MPCNGARHRPTMVVGVSPSHLPNIEAKAENGIRLPPCYANVTLHASGTPAASLQWQSESAGISPNNKGGAFLTIRLWARTYHVGVWHGYAAPVPSTVATKIDILHPLHTLPWGGGVETIPSAKPSALNDVVNIVVPLVQFE